MTDKTWTNWSDLKFVFKKKETWLAIAAALVLGVVVGSCLHFLQFTRW